MDIKFRDLFASREALERLSSEKLPIKASYNISRFIRYFNDEVYPGLQAFFANTVKEMGYKEGDKIPDEDIAKVQTKMEEYYDILGVAPVQKLKLKDLGSNASVTPSDLIILKFMIEDEDHFAEETP
jgi:hypothetical protein